MRQVNSQEERELARNNQFGKKEAGGNKESLAKLIDDSIIIIFLYTGNCSKLEDVLLMAIFRVVFLSVLKKRLACLTGSFFF